MAPARSPRLQGLREDGAAAVLTAGAAGASLATTHSGPPTRRGAGCPLSVGHRLGQGGHGAHSLQPQGRSNLGAGAARRPCRGLRWKESPGRAGSRPQHPQPQLPPRELALQLANQPRPSRRVPAAGSGPFPPGCPGGQRLRLTERPASSGSMGKARLPALAHAPLTHRRPEGLQQEELRHPCVSLLGSPFSQGVSQGFLEVAHPAWQSRSGTRWESRLPAPIRQEAGPSPRPAGHGAPGVWQRLAGTGRDWAGRWAAPGPVRQEPRAPALSLTALRLWPLGEERGRVPSQCLRAPSSWWPREAAVRKGCMHVHVCVHVGNRVCMCVGECVNVCR